MEQIDPQGWVDEHGDVLYRYALARLRNPERAEDVVQETFLAALQARESYGGRSTERTWLVGILRHKIIDQIRRQWREQPVTELESAHTPDQALDELFDARGMWLRDRPQPWSNPPQAPENKEFWIAFRQCMDHLPGRLGDAFALREMEESSSEEVCQILGITPTNLWAMLHRARVRLRQCLEKNWFGGPGGKP